MPLTEAQKADFMGNKILMRNLEAYLSQFPQDGQRLLNMVIRPLEKMPKTRGFTVGPPSKAYRARLCFILSIMSEDFWMQTAQTWNADAYFIIEPNPDAVAAVFQTQDITKFILSPKFHFFLGYSQEELIAPLQKILRHTAIAGKLLLSQVICPAKDEGVAEEYVAYAEAFNASLREIVDHVFFNFGNIDDSVEGLRASFSNLPKILESGGITELENCHFKRKFAVIGAGPSLDHDMELLAKHRDKFIIVAVDAAIKPLLKSGIEPDYAVTIERYQDGMQEQFFEGLPGLKTELVVFPVVHPLVIAKWPGKVRFTYRNYAWFAYFEKRWPRGILESGGSASHLATRLALHMGADKIYLVGCDMSYEKHAQDETWRSHCLSTAFPEWNAYKTEQEIKDSKSFYGFYDVEANDGSEVKTHVIYHQWAKEYGSLIVSAQADGKIVSTAAKGIKVPKMSYEPFEQVCSGT